MSYMISTSVGFGRIPPYRMYSVTQTGADLHSRYSSRHLCHGYGECRMQGTSTPARTGLLFLPTKRHSGAYHCVDWQCVHAKVLVSHVKAFQRRLQSGSIRLFQPFKRLFKLCHISTTSVVIQCLAHLFVDIFSFRKVVVKHKTTAAKRALDLRLLLSIWIDAKLIRVLHCVTPPFYTFF